MVQYFEQKERGNNQMYLPEEELVEIFSDLNLDSSFDDY